MDQVIVTLEGKDHKIGQGEHTVCGIPVPHGTPREEDQKPCKVCFTADEETPEPEPVFALSTKDPEPPAEPAADADPVEAAPSEPAKPVKASSRKATKAK